MRLTPFDFFFSVLANMAPCSTSRAVLFKRNKLFGIVLLQQRWSVADVTGKNTVFFDVTPFSLVDIYLLQGLQDVTLLSLRKV
jgi:hypothetical protein